MNINKNEQISANISTNISTTIYENQHRPANINKYKQMPTKTNKY